jgi:hypothetical protein
VIDGIKFAFDDGGNHQDIDCRLARINRDANLADSPNNHAAAQGATQSIRLNLFGRRQPPQCHG